MKTCGAKTRGGEPCKRRPVAGKTRCRLHGGASTGAPKGNTNGVTHGAYRSRGGLLTILPKEIREELEGVDIQSAAEEAFKLEVLLTRQSIDRVSEARGRLGEAEEDGDPEKIDAAQKRLVIQERGLNIHLNNLSVMHHRLSSAKAALKKAELDPEEVERRAAAESRKDGLINLLTQIKKGETLDGQPPL